jgi:AcrR family transcriptional regulator
LRLAAAEEARRRIVEAAAALHAEHGGIGTSHAMIARKAGVSVPTVYKYFPTGNDLIPACTGLVAGRAPLTLDDRIFEGLSRVPERVRAFARAVFRLHEYFAPWLRWSDSDAAAFPALQPFL